MTHVAPLVRVLAAVGVDPPDSYYLLGQRYRVVTIEPQPGTEWRALERDLAERLYADAYCTGGPAPGSAPPGGLREELLADDAEDLSPMNNGRGSPDGGWTVTALGDDTVLVSRQGITLSAGRGALLRGPGGVRVGDVVTLVLPKGSAGTPRGFATAYGDAGRGDGDEPVDRFYWNVRPESRGHLMNLVTTMLNREGMPFRFKVQNDPTTVRCDAAVLYSPSEHRSPTLRAVESVLLGMAGRLKPGTPLLTKRLARGLAFAEDPPGDDSFGTHRCALLAAAILDAHRLGRETERDRMALVAEHFARHGLSLDRPYLNPDGDDRLDPAPFEP